MEYLDIFVEEEEVKKEEQTYEHYKKLFDDVKSFLIQKKRVIYGGTALNEILPLSKKFYKEKQLPDYDVFTPTPKKDALELAKYLKNKGHSFIEIKRGFWHVGTFKVYAEFLPVVDFTFVRRKFYNFLLTQSKFNPRENQTNPRLKIAFPILLLWSFYKELSRPGGSLYRLKKVFTRFKVFQKEFGLKPKLTRFPLDNIPNDHFTYLEKMRNYLKETQLPFVGGFAIGLHLGANRRNKIECCTIPGIPMFDILSENIDKTLKEIQKVFPHIIIKKKESFYLDEIMPHRYLLKTNTPDEYTFARIFDTSDGCYSIKKINGYSVGKLDTILNFLYAQLIMDMFFDNKINDLPASQFTVRIIQELEKVNNKQTLKERFDMICWGKDKSKTDVMKEKWKNPNKVKISI